MPPGVTHSLMLLRKCLRPPRGLSTVTRLQSSSSENQTVRCMTSKPVLQRRSARVATTQHRACMSSTSTTDHSNQSHFNASVAAFLAGAGALSAYLLLKKSRVHCEPVEEQPSDISSASKRKRGLRKRLSDLPEIPKHVQYLMIGDGMTALSAVGGIWNGGDLQAQVLIVNEESHMPYERPPLSREFWYDEDGFSEDLQYVPWEEAAYGWKPKSIFPMPAKFYCKPKTLSLKRNGGVALLSGYKVVKLDTTEKKVYLDNGSEITYDKCLIAPGGKPKNLDVLENADVEVRKRTTVFSNLDDFQKLNQASDTAKSVAVIGGGFLGSELACGLSYKGRRTGMRVYQIFPESGNLGSVLPEYLSNWTSNIIKKEGVDVLPGHVIQSAAFVNNQIRLTLKDRSPLYVDHVVVAVGTEPNVSLATAVGLEVDAATGGLLVNSQLEARADVWVAGSAAVYPDLKLGPRLENHHSHAVTSAKHAGENMAGAGKPYRQLSKFGSNLGLNLGFEAVGTLDSSLDITAVFAKSDSSQDGAVAEEDQEVAEYGKGVVFYKKNNCVVGVLMWNVVGGLDHAKNLIMMDTSDEESLLEAAKMFKIH